MDFGLTWEGVAALMALAVSIYNLREARKEPARALERTLRNELRVALEGAKGLVEAQRKAIRDGDEVGSGDEFLTTADSIRRIAKRLPRDEARVLVVASQLELVNALCGSVVAARQSAEARESIEGLGLGHMATGLGKHRIDVKISDLDHGCQEAATKIHGELSHLHELESGRGRSRSLTR